MPALACFLLVTVSVTAALAQQRPVIRRIGGPVTLDGPSDEAAWASIEPLPLVTHTPAFGNPPSERTEILIAFDDVYLYLAGRLYDDPSGIQGFSLKRDELSPVNDYFGLVLDTFNDKENALALLTTPAGIRLDMTIFNDAQDDLPFNTSWDTFWDVAVAETEEGWFAELRIPISSLRFQEKDGEVVMGLIAWRYIARKGEVAIYPAVPPNWGAWSIFKPSQAQEVVFEGLHSRRPLYITPYVLGGRGRRNELNDAETAYDRIDTPTGDLGLDVKYGLTSNLTLDLTLNTDFAQVEADDQQVNLTRFSLFFPEKRRFFQERAAVFDFSTGGPNRLFYSRRIGLHEGQEVDILGGARLVGRVGGWDVGVLEMQTARQEDLPSENFAVARLRRQVFNPNSYVGLLATSRVGAGDSYNVAYGFDAILRLFGEDYLTLNWAQTFEDSVEGSIAGLAPIKVRVDWERRGQKGLGYAFGFARAGRTFNPGLGFEMREDFSRVGDRILYGWLPGESSPLQRHFVALNAFAFLRNADGKVESAEIGPEWQGTFKNSAAVGIKLKHFYEDLEEAFELSDETSVPAGRYTFQALEARYDPPGGRAMRTPVTLSAGRFYDGRRLTLGITPEWSASRHLRVGGFFERSLVTFPDRGERFDALVARLRVQLTVSTRVATNAFIQYSSAADALIANIRFRYNPREGTDLYVVYNHGINTDRYGYTPLRPRLRDRTLLLKYAYTFEF